MSLRYAPREAVIYRTYRTIFIHIPKTGGNSIAAAFGFGWPAHTDIVQYASTLRPDVFREYFKFAIVRNPWARLLSDYVFQRAKRKPRREKLLVYDDHGGRRDFAAWVRAALGAEATYQGALWAGDVSAGIHRWSPQVDWISLDGAIAVDYVARLEAIDQDFAVIRRRAGLACGETLPVRNRTPHRHYSHYYDRATRDLVGRYYAADVETLGYRFEERPRRWWGAICS